MYGSGITELTQWWVSQLLKSLRQLNIRPSRHAQLPIRARNTRALSQTSLVTAVASMRRNDLSRRLSDDNGSAITHLEVHEPTTERTIQGMLPVRRSAPMYPLIA